MAFFHPTGPTKTAIIGAGLSGLTCAQFLHQSGHAVTVFEKSRGLGGRLATRRVTDDLAFDHGAQFFTATSPDFSAFVENAVADYSATSWTPQLQGPIERVPEPRYVGTPSMNAFVKPLVDGIEVHRQTRIALVENVDGTWILTSEIGDHFDGFDMVVCTLPAPQARDILVKQPDVVEQFQSVAIAPCWALMIAFDEPVDTSIDAFRDKSTPVTWLARNGSKPGRSVRPECWVAHASSRWSTENLERDPEDVALDLIHMLPSIMATELPSIKYATAHRWRYALTTTPLKKPFVTDASQTLFVGGDWCLGARVEQAYESGRAIAEQIVTQTST